MRKILNLSYSLFALTRVLFLINLNCVLLAGSPQEEFEQANKLFEQGQITNAITIYENLIKNGKVSPAVYFNLGNAYFKAGKIGYSIYNYLIAQRLAPRDPDIRANLEFARKHVAAGAVLIKKDWRDALKKLTLNEWGYLFAFSVWIFFGMLAACQIKTNLRAKLKVPITFAAIMVVLLLITIGINVHRRISYRVAVSIVQEGAVRQGPLDQSPQKFPLKDGFEFIVVDTKDDWLQVSDNYGRIGWVKTNDVIVVPVW